MASKAQSTPAQPRRKAAANPAPHTVPLTPGATTSAPHAEGMSLSGPAASIAGAGSACACPVPAHAPPPTLAEAFDALSACRLFARVPVLFLNGQRGVVTAIRSFAEGGEEDTECRVEYVDMHGWHTFGWFDADQLSPATEAGR